MEYVLLISITLTASIDCRASTLNRRFENPVLQPLNRQLIQPYDVSDLESYNCNSVIESGPCATECGIDECYKTYSITGTTFPQDGFCSVFNISQAHVLGTDWYSVSSRICLSSSSYPQGTGLLFNYQSNTNYEMVYKTSQDSSVCYVGYVQYGVVRQTNLFDCGITTTNQWHRYTVAVYSDNTFEASLSTQTNNSIRSGRFPTNYPMSTRGGTLMLNSGSPGKLLQFDEISLILSSIDECSSSPCGSSGICIDGDASYICNCYLGYTGVHCETDINECASTPCQNGGNCDNFINGYNCTCVAGITGINCETDINECVSSPCENGGNCNDLVDGYTCTCSPEVTGINCETARCPGGYELYQNSCYRIGKEPTTWTDARSRCLADGADLVTIESQAEDDYLSTKLISCSTVGAWIGLTDAVVETDWRWVETGNTPGYTNWAPGQPDGVNQDCGVKWNSQMWKWDDNDCTTRITCYICEV